MRHECRTLTIPELSCDDSKVSLIYSLPTDANEGILVLEIIRHLQDVQNAFLNSFAEFTVHRRITLFGLRQHNLIDIDKATFLKLVQKYCAPSVTYGDQSALHFDFTSIENEIVDTFLLNRHPIEIDVRTFEFIGSRSIQTLIDLIERSIPQVYCSVLKKTVKYTFVL